MAAIPIHQAITRANNRYREVMSSALFSDLLTERESADYPLPPPEAWVLGPLNPERHFRALNVSEVVGAIWCEGPARFGGASTGDGEQYGDLQRTSYDVGVIFKAPQAFPEVTVGGRLLLDDEWMQARAEIYRGAIIDTVTRYAVDSDSIHEVMIESTRASLFEIPQVARYAHATVTFETLQDVLINTWV